MVGKKERDEGWTCHEIKGNVFPILGMNGSTIVFSCSSAAQLQQPDIAELEVLGRLVRGED